MCKKVSYWVIFVVFMFITGCSGSGNGNSVSLVSIAVTPITPTALAGNTIQFTATGSFTDNSTQDLTSQVVWSSSDLAKATISVSGLATAIAAGTSTMSATLSGQTGSTVLTVTAVTLSSIAVTPANPIVGVASTVQFTATGTYSNATTQNITAQVTWSSSATTIAAVSDNAGTKGLAAGVAIGTSNITATLGAVSKSIVLTVSPATLVSIAVTPATQTISIYPSGTTQQYTATGTYSDSSTLDLTDQVTWSSDNNSAATISSTIGSSGKASTVAAGTAHITATLGAISSPAATLTVTSATLVSLAITPVSQNLPRGQALQFTAIGTYSDTTTQNLTNLVVWASSVPAVATISNSAGSNGLLTALNSVASTKVSAASGGVTSNEVTIEVE